MSLGPNNLETLIIIGHLHACISHGSQSLKASLGNSWKIISFSRTYMMCLVSGHWNNKMTLETFRTGARPVYICSQLVYTAGALAMAISRDRASVLLLSPTAGVMYATLFTMPYFLVAHYHSTNLVSSILSNPRLITCSSGDFIRFFL